MNEIERAERNQAWKAFLIPTSLFIACLLNAAGIYIMYTGSTIGIVFLGAGLTVIVAGLWSFYKLQNPHRARGKWKQVSATLPEHITEIQDSDAREQAEAEDSVSTGR